MSKENNLTDFLTDIANAIRSKKGITDPINPQNFSAEIASIKTGGGTVVEGEGAYKITFIDYDGTILKIQYLNSGESATPPSTPTHEHLTFNKWVGSYTNVTKSRIVGAHYTSSDGNVWLHHNEGEYVRLYFTCTSEATIDWGDGNTEVTSSGGTFLHRYADNGHWISISSNSSIVFSSKTISIKSIDSIILNSPSNFGANAFQDCAALTSVVIPDGVTSIGQYALQNCTALTSVVIPDSVTSIGQYAFRNCTALTSVVIPDGVTSIANNAFAKCFCLISVKLPLQIGYIATALFQNCAALTSVVIPDSVTVLYEFSFDNCTALTSVVIPDSVTSIGQYAFRNDAFIQYAIVLPVTPPSLYNSSVFPSGFPIYVPDESITAYQEATNWSAIADRIKPLSEYTAE